MIRAENRELELKLKKPSSHNDICYAGVSCPLIVGNRLPRLESMCWPSNVGDDASQAQGFTSSRSSSTCGKLTSAPFSRFYSATDLCDVNHGLYSSMDLQPAKTSPLQIAHKSCELLQLLVAPNTQCIENVENSNIVCCTHVQVSNHACPRPIRPRRENAGGFCEAAFEKLQQIGFSFVTRVIGWRRL